MFSLEIIASLCVLLFPAALLAEASPPKTLRPPPAPAQKPQPPGEALFHDVDYNTGAYGHYVVQTFKSAHITAPRFNMMKPFTNCDDGSHLFLTPRGEVVTDTTAAIYDASGSLIWKPADGEYHEIYNFEMQEYKGQPYITFWSGDNSGGHGDGFYYMYDQHYNLTRKINAGNGLSADLHSFIIMPDDNALLTIYEKVTTDLAGVSLRPPKHIAYMWDCLFQEVNIETGNVTFEWRASDHFDLSESFIDANSATEKEPWDFFHINSVEKDAFGNYLVSSRHLRCVAYISGETGEVLWRLGGKKNSFEDLSGDATRFVGQHDAHFDEGGKYITLFDNRADWAFELEHVSKGRRIEIDTVKMTAKDNATYIHPDRIFTFSQGSYQTLPNGNVLLGYGFTGAVSEFDRNGTLLCDGFFQPKSRFSSGDVQSYRNLKFNWTGLPHTPPSAVIENGVLYVSWLGATEVRSWWIQDSTTGSDGRWAAATSFGKTGFETQFPIKELLLRQYVRIVALDAHQQVLGTSEILSTGDLAAVFAPVTAAEAVKDAMETIKWEQKWHDMGALFGFAILATGTGLVLFFLVYRPRLVKRWLLWKDQDMLNSAEKEGNSSAWNKAQLWWATRRAAFTSYHVLPQWAVEDRASSSEQDNR